MRPSHVPPDQMWVVRVYLESEGDPQVYTHVRHYWWTAGNSVLTILHYYDDGSHRYVHWPRERVWNFTAEREDPDVISA